MVTPYDEHTEDGMTVRHFNMTADEWDLVWHRDERDRRISVVDGHGWKFQFDNCMPFELHKGDEFFVEAMTYHRVIKGFTPLTIQIKEF